MSTPPLTNSLLPINTAEKRPLSLKPVSMSIRGIGAADSSFGPSENSTKDSVDIKKVTAPATITLSLSTNLLTAEKGKISTINAAVSTPGKVTFYANGKVIPGCIKKSATTSALCSWKPTIQGRVTALKALLVPNSSSYQDVFSPILGVTATRRSGLR